ncbi:MarR family winged helix-turn-helix transcriptional regulator [Aminobacter sp. Piv2-1]|uniref:MarR family winged helix-turn-helix transcriptional regulator n=1 Tax=Aminobacter sp. Piv2-1 TaxID=3031122 RepID=UPI0030B0B223
MAKSYPDHIGWQLWQASRAWQAEFADAMRAAGHGWFSESRAGLLGHIPRGGLKQSALIDRAGISKQAIQQLLDGMEAEGVIVRTADPDDRRGKLLLYTPKGVAALDDGDRIKLEIENRYRDRLGEGPFEDLMAALRGLAEARSG